MQTKYISYSSSNSPSLLQKSVAVVGTVVVAGVALMFSAVLLTVLLSVGAVMFAYLWWKTRALRRQMREQMKHFQQPGATAEREVFSDAGFQGEVIEGEVVRVDEPRVGVRH